MVELRKCEKYTYYKLKNKRIQKKLNRCILGDQTACKLLFSVDSEDVVASMLHQAEKHGKQGELEVFHFVYTPTETDEEESIHQSCSPGRISTFLVNEVTDSAGFISENVPVAGSVQRNERPEVHFLVSTVNQDTGRVYPYIGSYLDELVTMRERYKRHKNES